MPRIVEPGRLGRGLSTCTSRPGLPLNVVARGASEVKGFPDIGMIPWPAALNALRPTDTIINEGYDGEYTNRVITAADQYSFANTVTVHYNAAKSNVLIYYGDAAKDNLGDWYFFVNGHNPAPGSLEESNAIQDELGNIATVRDMAHAAGFKLIVSGCTPGFDANASQSMINGFNSALAAQWSSAAHADWYWPITDEIIASGIDWLHTGGTNPGHVPANTYIQDDYASNGWAQHKTQFADNIIAASAHAMLSAARAAGAI